MLPRTVAGRAAAAAGLVPVLWLVYEIRWELLMLEGGMHAPAWVAREVSNLSAVVLTCATGGAALAAACDACGAIGGSRLPARWWLGGCAAVALAMAGGALLALWSIYRRAPVWDWRLAGFASCFLGMATAAVCASWAHLRAEGVRRRLGGARLRPFSPGKVGRTLSAVAAGIAIVCAATFGVEYLVARSRGCWVDLLFVLVVVLGVVLAACLLAAIGLLGVGAERLAVAVGARRVPRRWTKACALALGGAVALSALASLVERAYGCWMPWGLLLLNLLVLGWVLLVGNAADELCAAAARLGTPPGERPLGGPPGQASGPAD